MSLYLNTEKRLIYMRRGDSGILQFVFQDDQNDLDGALVTFAVKVDRSDSDAEAVIPKTYMLGKDTMVAPNIAYFYLTPEDTQNLEIEPLRDRLDYQDYVWTLKIETEYGMLADTVIPYETDSFPKFRLYYGSVPDADKQTTIFN